MGKSSSQTCGELEVFKAEQEKDRPPGGSVAQQLPWVVLGQVAHGGGPSQQDTAQRKWSEPATTQKGKRGLGEGASVSGHSAVRRGDWVTELQRVGAVWGLLQPQGLSHLWLADVRCNTFPGKQSRQTLNG